MRQQVGGNGPVIVRVVLAEFFHRRLHAVDQLLIGRAVVRSAGSGRIVAVVAGRRGARMEVFGLGEILADQRGADDLPVLRDQAAVGLVRKENLADAGDHAGINQAGAGRSAT